MELRQWCKRRIQSPFCKSRKYRYYSQMRVENQYEHSSQSDVKFSESVDGAYDYDLPKSILFTNLDKWILKSKKNHKVLPKEDDLDDQSRRFQINTYANIIGSPVRSCRTWYTSLPSGFLERFSKFEISDSDLRDPVIAKILDPLSTNARRTLLSRTKNNGELAGNKKQAAVVLPVEDNLKGKLYGPTAYHIRKKEYLQFTSRGAWRQLAKGLQQSVSSGNADSTDALTYWHRDTPQLVEKRLNRRIERDVKDLERKCAKGSILASGLFTFDVERMLDRDNAYLSAILSWNNSGALNGQNPKDSDFALRRWDTTPIPRYYVRHMCGEEYCTRIRDTIVGIVESSSMRSAEEKHIFAINESPIEVGILESMHTLDLRVHLWQMRLFLGDRVQI
ncbi:hypothetical protein V1511DRAFT_496286, partial [Dipodascopsis uninucleata]